MIKLIVGLGNPGKDYQTHRHNAGFWFIESLAANLGSKFSIQSKFLGEACAIHFGVIKIYLLKPQNFMNNSGGAIKSLSSYYNIKPEEILVVHDELDLPAGSVKLKMGGGHGGHNGLRDTIKALNTNNFYRLRIGIGHPGEKHLVVDYVLKNPSSKERDLIDESIEISSRLFNEIASGQFEKAMLNLHTNK